eukprot:6437742-Prymnesium_polylepis.2
MPRKPRLKKRARAGTHHARRALAHVRQHATRLVGQIVWVPWRARVRLLARCARLVSARKPTTHATRLRHSGVAHVELPRSLTAVSALHHAPELGLHLVRCHLHVGSGETGLGRLLERLHAAKEAALVVGGLLLEAVDGVQLLLFGGLLRALLLLFLRVVRATARCAHA